MEDPSADVFTGEATLVDAGPQDVPGGGPLAASPIGATIQTPPPAHEQNEDVTAIVAQLQAEGMGRASAQVLAEDYVMLWQLTQSLDGLPFLRNNRPRVEPERKAELTGALAAEGIGDVTREVVADVHVWCSELYHGMFAVGNSKMGRRFLKQRGVNVGG